MTLTQLRTFIAVADNGSVRAAAEQLHVSQPSVSGSLAALGEEIGVPLTEREGRGMRLSPAGEVFLPHAREALGLLEQGQRLARQTADRESATVRIAAVFTAAEFLLPPLLRRFQKEHPDIPIQLDIGNRERVLEQLTAREADVGVGGHAPDDGMFEEHRIAINEHVVVAAPDHPLAGRAGVPVTELGADTWLIREEPSGSRRLVEEYLAAAGLAPRTTTIGSNSAIAAAAMVGLGVGIVPRVAVAHQIAAGALAEIDVDPPAPAREWFALLPVRRPSPAARVLVEFLSAAAGS